MVRSISKAEFEERSIKAKENVVKTLTDLNTAISKNDASKIAELKVDLGVAESEYKGLKRNLAFIGYAESKEPMFNALRDRTFGVLGHKEIKDETKTKTVRYELKSNVSCNIDFDDLAHYIKLNPEWRDLAIKLKTLMCVRNDVMIAAAGDWEKADLTAEQKLDVRAIALELGKSEKDAVSYASINGLIQRILDIVIFIPKEDKPEENSLRINNSEIEYWLRLMQLYDKSNPNNAVALTNNDFVDKIVFGICWAKANNKTCKIVRSNRDKEAKDYSEFDASFTVVEPDDMPDASSVKKTGKKSK